MDLSSSLEAEYQQAVLSWKAHCKTKQHSSNPNDSINCDAFEKIAAMGEAVLPLIQKTMHDDIDPTFCLFGWTSLIREIVGKKFDITEDLLGRVQAIFEFTRDWLDAELKNKGQLLCLFQE